MNKLPQNVNAYIDALPIDRNELELVSEIERFRSLYGDEYVNSIIWCQEDAKAAFKCLGIDRNSLFGKFYLHSFESPEIFRSEDLFGLSEILENFKNSFWDERYNKIGNRYLQLSSLEGEYSYFYDKLNDAIYGVSWNEMEIFMKGELPPLFPTFFEFIQWYYSEKSEE